jgi:hypothetical protein
LTGADALDLLFSERGDQPSGISYLNTTPYIVPFLIEILPHTNTHYRSKIMEIFAELIRNPYYITIGYGYAFKLHAIRQNKVVWDSANAIWDGYDTYKLMVSDKDSWVRVSAVGLLSLFTHKASELFPFFLSSLEREPERNNQKWLIRDAARLIGIAPYDRENVGNRTKYADDLLRVFVSHSDVSFRLEVALAYVELTRLNMDESARFGIFMPVDDQITQALKQHVETLLQAEKPSELDFPQAIQYLRMVSISLVAELLERENLSPIHAHMIVSALMNYDFERIDRTMPPWTYYHTYKKSNSSQIFYYRDRGVLLKNQIDALRLVVDCEPFWELPTNLLSFLFGLPDSRDELRALIEKT